MSDTYKKIGLNLFWKFAERTGTQGIQIVISIVLARILLPEVYGQIGLVLVFINILQVFVDSGLGNALIQKQKVDELDFSSVFYFNLIMGIVLYFLIFLLAPILASFFADNELVIIIRIMSLVIIISGVKNVQQAFVSRNMQFKKFFFSTIAGNIVSAIVCMVLIFHGFGIWALVLQNLVSIVIDTSILWIIVKWRPKCTFSIERLKVLFHYGWKILIATLIDAVFNNLRQLIIGKMYTKEELGFYNQGRQFPNLIVNNINSSMEAVLFPVLSQIQDDKVKVKEITRKIIMTSTYIMAPFMVMIAITATTLVTIILTEKWLPCVPFLRVFCVIFLFYPIQTANLNAIKAVGKSNIFLKQELQKKSIGVLLLLCTMWFGVMAMVMSLLMSSFISQYINSRPNKELIDYGLAKQMQDILPTLILSCIMGISVYLIGYMNISLEGTFMIQLVVGILVYIVGSIISRNKVFVYFVKMVNQSK